MLRTALLGLVLFAAPAAAQSTAILGRDDADFARELYAKGWTDLAQGVVKAYEKLSAEGRADPLAMLDVQAIGYDIKLDLARRDPDLNVRKQGIAEVIAAKEKLVEENPRTKIGRDTRDNLPDAYRLLGEALTAALAKETDASALTQLRSEGESAFARAESALKERLDGLKEVRLEENQEAANIQYMNALFNLGRTQYFHSRFYPAGDPSAEALLGIAVGTFEDLGLDYGDRLLNFEAIYYIGMCHKAQNKPDEALGDWDWILGRMREGFDTDSKGRYQFGPEVSDLVSKCVLQKVNLLTELNRGPEAIAAIDDFWTKTVEPEAAGSGLALLSAKADLQLAASDSTAAGETAKRLMELDPQGYWGNKGRELQVKLLSGVTGASVGPAEILRVANNLSSQGRSEQALDAAQQVLIAAKGDAKEQDFGSQALVLMGQIYRRKQWYHEASLLFDTAYERYPKGDAAPNALSSAMDCYARLNQQEKRPFYKTRMQERGQTLLKDFPNHPAASTVQQAAARELMGDAKYIEAAKAFRDVLPSSPGYAEAQVQAGTCLWLQGRALAKEKKLDQAKAQFTEAEAVFTKAIADITTAKGKTLDQQLLASLSNSEYDALTNLSRLYLEDAVAKPDKALATLKGIDERFTDPRAVEGIWQLRIRALEKVGSVDEAVLKFDELLRKQTDHAGLAGAAGVLARSLDNRALGLSKEPRTAEQASQFWRKAVNYYMLSVQPQLDNPAGTNAKSADLEAVAKRLLDLGMQFNGLAEDVSTFVGWKPAKAADTAAWEDAAKIYEIVVQLDPANYRARICQGRVLGFLQRWREAAAAYADMFESEPLVRPDKTGFDSQIVNNKPELLNAYLEWGVCEAETGSAEKDAGRQARASGIFDLLVTGTTQGSSLWWNAKFRQVNTLFQRGMYEPCDITLRNLERSTAKDFADPSVPPGIKQDLLNLRTEVSKLVINKPK